MFDQGVQQGLEVRTQCKAVKTWREAEWELKKRWVPRVLRPTHTDTIMLSVSDHVMQVMAEF